MVILIKDIWRVHLGDHHIEASDQSLQKQIVVKEIWMYPGITSG